MYHVGEFLNCLMSGTRRSGGPDWRRNGWWRSSAAVARWAGSRTSILSRKPWRRGETWTDLNHQSHNHLNQNMLIPYLLRILELWRGHVSYPPHGLQRRFIEEGRLAVHHLHYHDPWKKVS